eukprot:TRINITY_DN100856_c0_g1_i1.p1 TRINITY_DN100856_c0_g1~~TRINITY_DN100856_c0_g1_i1.p1  ORF type:complete len:477 (+),score=112.96 TRINITY_DN100856_c0_g1_i1:132-1562(+)
MSDADSMSRQVGPDAPSSLPVSEKDKSNTSSPVNCSEDPGLAAVQELLGCVREHFFSMLPKVAQKHGMGEAGFEKSIAQVLEDDCTDLASQVAHMLLAGGQQQAASEDTKEKLLKTEDTEELAKTTPQDVADAAARRQEKKLRHKTKAAERANAHALEVTKLQDEIAELKKQLVQQQVSLEQAKAEYDAEAAAVSRGLSEQSLPNERSASRSPRVNSQGFRSEPASLPSRSRGACEGEATAPHARQTFWQKLRCPARVVKGQMLPNTMSSSLTSEQESAVPGQAVASHCRFISWTLLNAVENIMCLLCDTAKLQILQASKEAEEVFKGDFLLTSRSFLTLLSDTRQAQWLSRAIQSRCNLAQLDGNPEAVAGFDTSRLGRFSFCDRIGLRFDAVLTVGHLPAEPALGVASSVILILQPMNGSHNVSKAKRHACDALSQGDDETQSVNSEISLTPSDSVSQVMPRGSTYGEMRYGGY